MEYRANRGLEVRRADPGTKTGIATLDGYASVTGVWMDIFGGPEKGGWREMIEHGAFAKTIAEQRDAMFLLEDHDGSPFAGTRNGSLDIEEDERGLPVVARMATEGSGNEARAKLATDVESGLLDSMSIGFQVTRHEVNEDRTERVIKEIRLFEVSVVKWPANKLAVVQMRDEQRAAIYAEAGMTPETRAGMSLEYARAIAQQHRITV